MLIVFGVYMLQRPTYPTAKEPSNNGPALLVCGGLVVGCGFLCGFRASIFKAGRACVRVCVPARDLSAELHDLENSPPASKTQAQEQA